MDEGLLHPSTEPGLCMRAKPVHGIHSIMSYNRTPNQLNHRSEPA